MKPVTRILSGQINGSLENEILTFRGIPFAAAPVGERRWQAPGPVETWTGIRDALHFGPACPQESHPLIPPIMQVGGLQDEDCLYLNIWTPGLTGERPVMVWIHGGGFALGAASQAHFDGQNLARRGDVVVVTVNYRLGPLGFVHLDQVTNGAIPATGNEGLLDQSAALQWVQANIETFGGNPHNVTIFGESAGAMSVSSLLAMPSAHGLFHKAIPQSGAAHNSFTIAEATEWIAQPMVEALGTTDADALRAMTPNQLIEACPKFVECAMSPDYRRRDAWARPVIDGTGLPCRPVEALAAGVGRDIAILAGTTRDETSATDADLAVNGVRIVERLEEELPGLPVRRLVSVYREARQLRGARTDAPAIYAAILSHRNMWIPTTRLLDAQRPHGPVYQYIFDWNSPAGDSAYGALHGIDIGFVFATHAAKPALAAVYGKGPAADALAHAVIDAWTSFARTGDPSTTTLGEWQPCGDNRETMRIGEDTGLCEAPLEIERRAWDEVADEQLIGR